MYVILKINNTGTNLLCNTNTQQFPSIILHNRSFLYSENISSITKSSKFWFIKNYLHSLFDVFISFFKIVSLFILFLFFPFSFLNLHYQKQPHPEVFLGKRVLKIYSKFTGEKRMSKCDFNKVAMQLDWNHTSAWVFFCKFAAYFQNTFS